VLVDDVAAGGDRFALEGAVEGEAGGGDAGVAPGAGERGADRAVRDGVGLLVEDLADDLLEGRADERHGDQAAAGDARRPTVRAARPPERSGVTDLERRRRALPPQRRPARASRRAASGPTWLPFVMSCEEGTRPQTCSTISSAS
jgi:hypothetical protein